MQEQDGLAGSNVLVVSGDSVNLDRWHGGIVSIQHTEVCRRMPGLAVLPSSGGGRGPNA
jgi:hypothetical protein